MIGTPLKTLFGWHRSSLIHLTQTNLWVFLPLAGLNLLVFLYQKQNAFLLAKSLCILHLNLWIFLCIRYIQSIGVVSCQTNHWVVLPLAGLSLLVFLYQKQKVFPLAKSLNILHLNLWVFLYIVRVIQSRRIESCQTNIWVFLPLAGLTLFFPVSETECLSFSQIFMYPTS